MRLANVPPPMALQEVTLISAAIDVTMTVKVSPEPVIMIAVLHSTGISLFEWPMKSMAHRLPELKCNIPLQEAADPMQWSTDLQISFASENILLVLRHDSQMTQELVISTKTQCCTEVCFNVSKNVECFVDPGPIRTVASGLLLPDQDIGTEAVGLDQEITAHNQALTADGNPFPLTIGLFSSPHASIEAIKYDRKPPKDHCDATLSPIVFTLAENGSLFADRRCLTKHCTSFVLTPAHLIYTTSQHLLKFVHLADAISGTCGSY